jgi:hypothetical protein
LGTERGPPVGRGRTWNLDPLGPWRNRVRRGFAIEDDQVKMTVKSFVTMITFN